MQQKAHQIRHDRNFITPLLYKDIPFFLLFYTLHKLHFDNFSLNEYGEDGDDVFTE